ncbi:MAG: hypothetical protein R3E01_18780 [Pirellulaceae bacterium]
MVEAPHGPASSALTFKIADTPQELEQIDQLLYRTFVLEVPRYDDPGTDRLTDKFHERNVYFVAVRGDAVQGMVAVHDRPPFSVASAMKNPGLLDELGPRIVEARILAIKPEERGGMAFWGLACAVCDFALVRRYDAIVITGLTKRQRMYEKMGFGAIGPPVLLGAERFTPMAANLSAIPPHLQLALEHWRRRHGKQA